MLAFKRLLKTTNTALNFITAFHKLNKHQVSIKNGISRSAINLRLAHAFYIRARLSLSSKQDSNHIDGRRYSW